MTSRAAHGAELDRRLVLVLAAAAGVAVANIYYAQPLLPQLARSLGITAAGVGYVPMLTQVGYALGLALFIPLGDVLDRKRLMLVLVAGASVALLGMASARGVTWLSIASFVVGVTSVVPHVAVPLAAHLAPPADRGRIIGILMSGILIGILLARTVSGGLAEVLGWRGVFAVASGGMVVLGLVLRAVLPATPPPMSLPYPSLLASMVTLTRTHRELREATLIAASGFAAFSAFWTTLAFLLAGPPYFRGSGVAGLFGLVGATGALAAPLVGRITDRRGARTSIGVSLALALSSFGVSWLGRDRPWALVAGVILLDVGWQSGHVANLARIHGLDPEARSRLNTIYMVGLFVGGACGTWVGAHAWYAWGWSGVSAVGAAFFALALAVWARGLARAETTQPPAAGLRPKGF